jgi:hypothetical protein
MARRSYSSAIFNMAAFASGSSSLLASKCASLEELGPLVSMARWLSPMVQLRRQSQSRGSNRRLAASMEAWDRLGEGELLASSASEHKDPAESRR